MQFEWFVINSLADIASCQQSSTMYVSTSTYVFLISIYYVLVAAFIFWNLLVLILASKDIIKSILLLLRVACIILSNIAHILLIRIYGQIKNGGFVLSITVLFSLSSQHFWSTKLDITPTSSPQP